MEHQDDELSDVVVVLVDEPGMTTEAAAEQLKPLGLEVSNVDEENGVVEGTIETAKIKSLQRPPFVKYVRTVFNYLTDSESNAAKNQDSDEDDLSSEADDAGA